MNLQNLLGVYSQNVLKYILTWGHKKSVGLDKSLLITYHILSSIMHIWVKCAPEFYNDFCQKNIFIFQE